MAELPETATATRNHFVLGISPLRRQTIPRQAPSAMSAVQMPTMVSNAQCSIVLAGGRSSGGTLSRPVTCVLVLHPTRNESKPVIPMMLFTLLVVDRPEIVAV